MKPAYHEPEASQEHLFEADFVGPALVRVAGQPIPSLATKGLLLLGYLVVQPQRPHSRSRLASLLWPGVAERDARASLRQVLSNLRRDLGEKTQREPLLHATRTSLQLSFRDGDRVDIRELEALVTAGAQPTTDALDTVAGRIRGVFLEGLEAPSGPFEDWLVRVRRDTVERSVRVLGDLAEHHLAEGALDEAEDLAVRQLHLRPSHERAFRQRMRVAEASGRRQDALLLYERCHEALLERLGVRPSPETRALQRRLVLDGGGPPKARPESGAEARPEPSPPIPPLARQLGARSSLVGRARECAEVRALFEGGARLITLQGPGGMGKTRLAEAIGLDLEPDHADGVLWVHAAHVETSQELAVACLQALPSGASSTSQEIDTLVRELRARELLLILDEIELPARLGAHLELLPALLAQCPRLRVLTTSRTRLKLTDEAVFFVQGLAGDAEALFRERIHDHYPALVGPDEEAARNICALVDGVPLTVELAARLTRTLSVQDIARLLPDLPEILRAEELDADDRHRSVEAIFQPTWSALPASARTVLARCALFQGPFLLEAGRAIAGLTPDILAELIDASMVRQVTHRRYDLHTFLRQLVLARLVEEEPLDRGRERHARWFGQRLVDLVHRAYGPDRAPEIQLPQPVRDEPAVRALVSEDADHHAAVRWWRAHGSIEQSRPVIEAWWRHLMQRNRWVEADEHLAVALRHHPATASDTVTGPIYWTYLRGLTACGHFASDRAITHLEASLALLGTPVPASPAARQLATVRFMSAAVLGRSAPLLHEPRLTRPSLVSASRTALFTPYVVRRGMTDVSYVLMGAVQAASANPVPARMRASTQVAAGMGLGLAGQNWASKRLFEAGEALLAQVEDPVTRHLINNIRGVRGLIEDQPLSMTARAYEELWQDLPSTFKHGILGMEVSRAALVSLYPSGDLSIWGEWVRRGQRASRTGTVAARVPFDFYAAFRESYRDPIRGWELAQLVEQEDLASDRGEGHRPVIQCGVARVAVRAGKLGAALERVDAACDALEQTAVRPSLFTSHLMIAPARTYLAQWQHAGELSRTRRRHLARALSQLGSIGRTSHLFRAEHQVLLGLEALLRGRPRRAVSHWRAGRNLGARTGAGLAEAEALAFLAEHGPLDERDSRRAAAAARYEALGILAPAVVAGTQ